MRFLKIFFSFNHFQVFIQLLIFAVFREAVKYTTKKSLSASHVVLLLEISSGWARINHGKKTSLT